MPVKTIWTQEGRVFLIDQTLLPTQKLVIEIVSVEQMWEAIRKLRVRGAPAIGIAAAFGVWLAVRPLSAADAGQVHEAALKACSYLATSRPTAVNLFWALDRMKRLVEALATASAGHLCKSILEEATRMIDEDNEICLALGRYGAALLHDGARVLTHCNAGGLATAQYGTALSVVYYASEREGKKVEVFADETRPLLQGARLTAWELSEAGIPVTLICDNMAGVVMQRGWVDAVIVGTDRVARNGDVANKIGTYTVAVLARRHGIPFYVAAPLSSIDISIASGADVPIEERSHEEVSSLAGVQIAPPGVRVFNPAFDVTPHELVTALITERGVVRAPYDKTIPALFEESLSARS